MKTRDDQQQNRSISVCVGKDAVRRITITRTHYLLTNSMSFENEYDQNLEVTKKGRGSMFW